MGQKHTLFFAAEKGRNDDLRWVLYEKKVSPNLRDHETQEVALHLAASKGHVECVKLLLNAGANVDARNSYGLTPLHLAVCDGKVGCVQALIEGGADVNATSRFGCTPLHQAAYFGRLKCCQALLHAGAWVDVVESWGRTPLFLAIEKNNIDIVTLLLKHKASVHIRESIKGHTSLILASSLGNTACMRCLLDYCADPNCQDIFGHTPLHYVVKDTTGENTDNCIRQLAAYGAVCLRDNNDKSPVDILLDKNRISDAETLIKLTCKPRSLRSICWVKVRQNLQRQKILDLHELKVPKCIINFIEDDVAFLKTD